jgi:hypothetical protein
MRAKEIIEAVVERVKAELSKSEKVLESELTPKEAERVGAVLTQAMAAAWVEGYQAYLKAHDTDVPTMEVDGETYRWKMASPKEFLTPGGPMVLARSLYQADSGGKCHIPLDVAWGMVGQFATVEVREAALFAVAQLTPREVEALLKKCATFHPSAAAIQAMTQEMGQWLETHPELPEEIRAEEECPEGTRALVASLDGVNVLLAEPGPKRGRPAERPQGPAAEVEDSPTCYKNAMVGSVSWYGDVPEGEVCPERLASRYVARMPEDGAGTLKAEFERELADAEAKLDGGVRKILLCDGARSLWKYADAKAQYDDYEKLVDFYHATEHLSKAAEALFGKGSEKATKWYEKYRRRLQHKHHAVTGLLRSIDYYCQQQKLSASRRKALATERTFFENNQDRMDYRRFRRRGWPIGSGPVEAAGKTLVKVRMCRSGMRWSRSGGQYVLSLRTYLKSERWDTMWQRYKVLAQTAG